MPLDTPGLQSSLTALAAAPGADIPACAQQWADAMKDYALAIVPASLAVTAAAGALKTALEAAFALPVAAPAMETAFATFATAVGGGMAPAFVPTPPPGPVGFATLFASAFPATHAIAAANLTAKIDPWMKTGSATPAAGGAPVSWT